MTGNGHGAVQVRVRAVRLGGWTVGAAGGPGGPVRRQHIKLFLFLHVLTIHNNKNNFIGNVFIKSTADSGVVILFIG